MVKALLVSALEKSKKSQESDHEDFFPGHTRDNGPVLY